MTDIRSLTPEQRQQFEQRLQAARLHSRPGQLPASIPVRQTPPDQPYPLSPAQTRLWYLHQLAPHNPIYNRVAALHIRGALTPAAAQAALSALLQRHSLLRSAVIEQAGQPLFRLHPAPELDLPLVDLRHLPADERPAALDAWIQQQAQIALDLTQAPLLRAHLLCLADDEHVLLLVIHHIVFDAWSAGILLHEMAALLNGHTLPPLPLQFSDFAAYAAERAAQPPTPAMQAGLQAWQRLLHGAPPGLDLPTERLRPAVQQPQGGRVALCLPGELVGRAQHLAQSEDATLFMLLLAVWQALLQRHIGQDDFVIGTPVAGRHQAELEGLIGFFINLLALRADLSADPGLRDLLRRVRVATQEAFAIQETPFEQVVQALHTLHTQQPQQPQHPPTDPSRSPLFQVTFNLKPPLPAPVFSGPLQVTSLPAADGLSPYELGLEFTPQAAPSVGATPSDLHGWLVYAAALFDSWHMQALAQQYLYLLQTALEAPDTPLSQLPLMTAEQRYQALVTWNQTARPYPHAQSLAELFARQAAQQPQAQALLFGDDTLSYLELEQQANRLAHYLRAQGVGRGDWVAVALPRTPLLIVSILAVLKAGAAYVPLDPDYPAARLSFMLADAQPKVLLNDAAWQLALPPGETRLVRLEQVQAEIAAYPPQPPQVAYTPGDAACLLYTSGSTGQPKGSIIPQRGVVRMVLGSDYWQAQPGERVVHAANISFDAATLEIWSALLNGACLVGVWRETALDPAVYARFLRQTRIDHLVLTTALFHQLAALQPDAFASLKTLMIGGEALNPAYVQQVFSAGRPQRLLNLYGPTENTTLSTWYEVTHVPPQAVTLPIGRPAANCTAFVLDAHLQPVPPGVPGELYLGGDGLAGGYWRRPGLTAEKFIPMPDWGLAPPPTSSGDTRLYRTGDRVRQLPDGAIEFLGRLDQQVKLRGFRIELGEIESALLAHPAVAQAVVLLRQDAAAGPQLVAYICAAADTEIDPVELRAFLSQRLPDYMLPARLQSLPGMPLTPNGKLDRTALAAYPLDEALPAAAFQPPRSALERLLAGVWGEVLGRSRIGREDDFFALGGHSLLALRLTAQLNDLLEQPCPLRLVFEAPRLCDYAAALSAQASDPAQLEKLAGLLLTLAEMSDEEAQAQLAEAPAPAAEPAGECFPLSPVQMGMLYTSLAEPQAHHFVVQWRMDMTEALNRQHFWHAWREVIARHAIQRTSFHWQAAGEPYQCVHAEVELPAHEHDLSHLSPDAQKAALADFERADREQALDLAQAPAFRLNLFRLNDQQWVFYRTSHHLIHDGRSSILTYQELFARYAAWQRDAPLPLDPAPPYREMVEWLAAQNALAQAPGSPARRYWQAQLGGLSGPAALPFDRPIQASETPFGFAQVSLRLPEALSASLYDFARQHDLTPNTLVQGAWALVLATAALDDGASLAQLHLPVVFGAPRAMRKATSPHAAEIMGPVLNTLPVRVDVDAGQPLLPWLQALRQTWLELRAFESSSLFALREWAGYPAGAPIFESAVNFDHVSLPEALRLAGVAQAGRKFHYVQGAEYALALNAYGEAQMLFNLTLDTRRVSPPDGERLLRRLAAALAAMPGAQNLGDILVQAAGV